MITAEEMEERSPAERLDDFFKQTIRSLGVQKRLPEIFVSERSALARGEKVGRRLAIDDSRTTTQYTQLFSVAALVMDLVKNHKTMSQRDVYYSLKALFPCQAKCNSIIIDLGMILGLRRHEMGIHASSKGLIAGPLRFRFLPQPNEENDSAEDSDMSQHQQHQQQQEIQELPPWQDCLAAGASGIGISITSRWVTDPSCLVDAQLPPLGSQLPRPRYIIVIEKEGIFARLVEDEAYLKLPAILMTACGYPDVASRACLARLTEIFPELLVLGLSDYNSYGLAVLLSYKLPTKVRPAKVNFGMPVKGRLYRNDKSQCDKSYTTLTALPDPPMRRPPRPCDSKPAGCSARSCAGSACTTRTYRGSSPRASKRHTCSP